MGDSPEHDNNVRNRDETPSLEDLECRLERARSAHAVDPHSSAPQSGLATALRLGAEMISALLVGGAIGWFLDRWLDTKPWLLLVFLLLGAIAGLLNAYRAAMKLSPGYKKCPRDA